MHICACSLKKYPWCTVFMSVFLFLVFCGVHKSLFNVFPRSEMVRGNVVTHLMCGLCAWLSLDWPHLTPPAGSITDPHLSHFLSTTYTPPSPHASDCPPPLLFRWLQVYKVTREAEGSRKVCQRQTARRWRTKEGQDGPGSTRCPPLCPPSRTYLQRRPCPHLKSCQDTATSEMREKWEGEQKKDCQRETGEEATRRSRWRSRSCRPRGREDGRENTVTRPVIRGKHLSWLTWKFNTTTHYCPINPSFSALCAKPVPFSLSFPSLSFYLSLCAFLFSVAEDKSECDALPECFSQSDVDQAPPQPVTIQREEKADGPPRKKFLRAGLYSDDYKTTEWVDWIHKQTIIMGFFFRYLFFIFCLFV